MAVERFEIIRREPYASGSDFGVAGLARAEATSAAAREP